MAGLIIYEIVEEEKSVHEDDEEEVHTNEDDDDAPELDPVIQIKRANAAEGIPAVAEKVEQTLPDSSDDARAVAGFETSIYPSVLPSRVILASARAWSSEKSDVKFEPSRHFALGRLPPHLPVVEDHDDAVSVLLGRGGLGIGRPAKTSPLAQQAADPEPEPEPEQHEDPREAAAD